MDAETYKSEFAPMPQRHSLTRVQMRLFSSVAGLTLITAGAVQAQAVTPKRVPPSARTVAVTLNPFALFAEYIAGDVEKRIAPAWTIGAGGTINTIEDFNNYRALEAKVRYYPSEKALQGFSVAGTVGFATGKGDDCSNGCYYTFDRGSGGGASGGTPFIPGDGFSDTRRRVTRATIGTELSYQWILGPRSRFVTVVGLGAKRFLGEEGAFGPLDVPLLPTARINIGIAF